MKEKNVIMTWLPLLMKLLKTVAKFLKTLKNKG